MENRISLLDYAIETVKNMETISSVDFAKYFIKRKCESFHLYNEGLITSSSHGADFFQNIIKYWDNPDLYYTPKGQGTLSSKIPSDDYEYNFIKLLKNNKN